MNQLKIDKFLDYNYLANLKTSPKKTHLSFTVAKANYDANNYNHNLYLSDGEKHNQVLNLNELAFYTWEDEENILYFSEESETDKKLKELKYTVVYRYNLKNDKTELAYQFKIPVSSIEVLNDNNLLLTANLNENDHQLLSNNKERQTYLSSLEKANYFHIVEEVPFQNNGSGFIDQKRSQAFIYDVKKDSYSPLLAKDVNFGQYEVNHDKTVLYFTSQKASGIPTFFNDISMYDLKSKTVELLYTKQKVSITKLILLADELFVMGDDKTLHKINQNSDFYKLVNNDLEKVLDFGLSANNSIGSDVRFGSYRNGLIIDKIFYFIGTSNDRSILYSFDGKSLQNSFSYQGSLETFIDFKDSFYGIGLFNNNLLELYELNLKTNLAKAISDLNTENIKDTYIAKPILHQFENDGQALDGWVLLPKNYDQDKKYPAILDIHGGPKTIYADVFYHEMQVWANLGYIVFFTNPRGGDAYGDDFANIRGKYGTIDYDDLMVFTDLILDTYSIDRDKVGVTGGSYGGFMTNWIISHTDRFKVAATQRSISNWISFYGTSDIGSYFGPDQTDGHPIIDHDKVWEQSPLKHAQNIKTPLLFIHSDQDYRCPIEQAMQLYTVVKMNGVDTRFAWFKGENHDLSRSGKPQARLLRLEEITNWMNKYLKI